MKEQPKYRIDHGLILKSDIKDIFQGQEVEALAIVYHPISGFWYGFDIKYMRNKDATSTVNNVLKDKSGFSCLELSDTITEHTPLGYVSEEDIERSFDCSYERAIRAMKLEIGFNI